MTHLLFVNSIDKNDDPFGKMLFSTLRSHRHRVTTTQEPASLSANIAIHRPDGVLIDLTSVSTSEALEICLQLRAWSRIPVIIMSACRDETVKVKVLDAGADDYLLKPFGINELLARIRAIQRRSRFRMGSKVPQVQIGALTVNLDTQQVLLGNQIVPLTQKEFGLLRVLILAQGHPVSYSNLLRAVWDREDTGEYMRIRLTIRKLRAKLGENVDKPQFILTEDTVGYRINIMAVGVI